MSLIKKFSRNQSYEINLDLPPSRRWNDVMYAYRDELQEIIPHFQELLSTMFGFAKYPAYLAINAARIAGGILYQEEIQAIAEFLNMKFEDVLLLQLCYELNSCCTSIVTNVDGEKTFFRTMDWPLNFLNGLTIDLEFTQSGETLFHATSWVGYVGIATATVPNKYSIAMNFRLTKDRTISNILSNVYALLNMKWPVGYLIREVCSSKKNLNDTIVNLCKSSVVSPCYLTICPASTELPFVITRDPDGYSCDSSEYVIQTNCDKCKCEPNILHSVERRELAKQIVAENSNNFSSVDELARQLLVEPIVNVETIYYTIMNPKTCLHYSATYNP